jgi:hypothetical protein
MLVYRVGLKVAARETVNLHRLKNKAHTSSYGRGRGFAALVTIFTSFLLGTTFIGYGPCPAEVSLPIGVYLVNKQKPAPAEELFHAMAYFLLLMNELCVN